jgi:hypothetical protein
MRKGTQNAYNAWIQGRTCRKQRSLWTDGVTIYSYATPILWRDEDGRHHLDARKYSVTTTVHQNGLRVILNDKGITYLYTM